MKGQDNTWRTVLLNLLIKQSSWCRWWRRKCIIWFGNLVVGRTENNVIFISFASESAGSIIKCIAISSWTSLLENCGIIRGLACCWVCKLSTAAVLIWSKCFTGTPTPNYIILVSFITTDYLKFFWTTYNICNFLMKKVLWSFYGMWWHKLSCTFGQQKVNSFFRCVHLISC